MPLETNFWYLNNVLDGNGYVEDGRDIFDDDLDSQSIAQASANKGKGTKRKKNVADISSKSNIQQMLSNLPNKKKEVIFT